MKNCIFLLVLFFSCSLQWLNAQNAHFIRSGRIVYERKLNLYAIYDQNKTWSEERKSRIPQFKSTFFDLIFTNEKTLYQPDKNNVINGDIPIHPAEENTVLTDLANEIFLSKKKIFDKSFLVQDSLRKIGWKLTDERRMIAGFECKRANALIMDSIYVVAFYTEEILSSGGPESFSGLPGMILGIALPQEHITWFATNVYELDVNTNNLQLANEGKKVNNTQLKEDIKELNEWGLLRQFYIKVSLL